MAIEWIKVSERLPDKDMPVLVFIADRASIMLTQFLKACNDFALARVGAKSGFCEHGVTHWAQVNPPTA